MGVLACRTAIPMNPTRTVLFLETMGPHASSNVCGRRHLKNQSYQPEQGLEREKDLVVAHLATLI